MPHLLAHPARRLRRHALRLKVSERGVAAVEFAFILPIIVAMYFGMAELTSAIGLDRKVTLVSRTLADLVGRTQTMTTTEMTNVFNAAKAVLAPYPTTEATLVISSIKVTKVGANMTGTVAWSCAQGTGATKLNPNSSYPVPDGFKNDGTSFIVAQVGTKYRPMVGETLFKWATGTGSDYISLSETTPWPVRNVTSVEWKAGDNCPA